MASITDVKRISPAKLAPLVRNKAEHLAVIDVRDSDYIGGHIAGGTNVPVHTHDYKMPELVRTLKDKDTVVFHCALSQQRGPSAALRYLRERERLLGASVHKKDDGAGETTEVNGQTVYVLEGGFVKWQEAYVPLPLSSYDVILMVVATEKTRNSPKTTKRTFGSSVTER